MPQLELIYTQDSLFGADSAPDHRLPLVYLRELRRELVLKLEKHPNDITMDQVRDVAAIHQAICAIETVLTE